MFTWADIDFSGLLTDFFSYQQGKPLLFTQSVFWVFFAVVLFFYSFLYRFTVLRSIYLFAISLFFYFKTSGVFVSLLIFTIMSDYCWGWLIYKNKKKWLRLIFVTCSVLINLSLLGYFKYAVFIHNTINELLGTDYLFVNQFSVFSNQYFNSSFSIDKLILPVGISFFTFQSLSYIIDLYRMKIKPAANILEYGFFVCFFPHLVAGPIVKAHEFMYQIHLPYKLTRREFAMAVFWILNGLGKKTLADYIGVNFVDRIFDNPNYYSGVEVILGIFSYSLQIYADFSGYTDIAIGVALLLGFHLKTNFNSPYKAQSTSEFWQRWHISLSSWLKEYLYFSLGGNKKGGAGTYLCTLILAIVFILLSGKWILFLFIPVIALIFGILMYYSPAFRKAIHTNINIMITMLLGGLWHGSSWMFMIWGGMNGLGIVMHKLWKKISPFRESQGLIGKIICIFITLCFISFTRIWFRSANLEIVSQIFDRIQQHFGLDLLLPILSSYKIVLMVVFVGYLIHWIPEKTKIGYRNLFCSMPLPLLGFTVLCFVFILYQVMRTEMQPFIYFQF